jgi:6,7-dimethyl-8-ribityllumazine synthase
MAELLVTTIKTIEGNLRAADFRFAIVAARFNDFIVAPLLQGAIEALNKQGAGDASIEIVRVPGAFELPLAAQRLAQSKRYHAIIALGAVIKGATAHFEYVSGECAAGLARVALDAGIPVTFGVLTTDTIEQAVERAGPNDSNKGAEAALVAVEMATLLQRLDQS